MSPGEMFGLHHRSAADPVCVVLTVSSSRLQMAFFAQEKQHWEKPLLVYGGALLETRKASQEMLLTLQPDPHPSFGWNLLERFAFKCHHVNGSEQ